MKQKKRKQRAIKERKSQKKKKDRRDKQRLLTITSIWRGSGMVRCMQRLGRVCIRIILSKQNLDKNTFWIEGEEKRSRVELAENKLILG